MKKYELLKKDRFELGCCVLYRIRALRTFGNVKAGDLGGYVESENNLSHDGNAWIADEAMVSGSAHVSGSALVDGHALVSDSAQICDLAHVGGWVEVSDQARISGRASISALRPDPGPPAFRAGKASHNTGPRP
jgi:hypothetical protein